MKQINKKGFTLVELVVAAAVSATLLTVLVMLLTNFRAGYSKSEASGILLQETVIFIAKLRTDLNNAVLVQNNLELGFEDQLFSSENQLVFNTYNSAKGLVEPVVYATQSTEQGRVITRKEGNEAERVIVKNKVASISWPIILDTYPTKPLPTKRVRIELSLTLEALNQANKAFHVKTNLFPVRLNKQLN
jgi:prepilin-type N-terminal cleavage/methylation domain-containing protein